MQHSAVAVAFSAAYTGAANCDRRDTGLQAPEHCEGPAALRRHLTQERPQHLEPPAKEHGRVDCAPKLNTEEKVDGGEVSAWQRHCHHQPQRQLVDRAKELGVWMDLGKTYRRTRLQLRLADYLSIEELGLRFLKRPDNAGCVSSTFQPQSWRVRERDQHGTGPRNFGGEADRTGG